MPSAVREVDQLDAEADRRHKIAGLFCKAYERAVLLTPTEENVRIWAECTRMTQEEIEELNAWLSELSLEHRTYAERKAPNEVWNGGSSYQFNVNDGELSFAWVYIDKAYFRYDGEWYEITNTSAPPLNLDV